VGAKELKKPEIEFRILFIFFVVVEREDQCLILFGI